MERSDPTRTCRRCGREFSISRGVCPQCGQIPASSRGSISSVNPFFFLLQPLALFVFWVVYCLAAPEALFVKYNWVFFSLSQGTAIVVGIAGTVVMLAVVVAFAVAKRRSAAEACPPAAGNAVPRKPGSRKRREDAPGPASPPPADVAPPSGGEAPKPPCG